MPSNESPVAPCIRIVIHCAFMLTLLINYGFAIGLTLVDAWLLPTYYEFTDQNRSEDEVYALIIFIIFILMIIHTALLLRIDLRRYYKFQSEGFVSLPYRLHPVVDIFQGLFEGVFLHQFLQWHAQFKASGDSRSATYCTLATVLLASNFAWMLFYWLLPAYYALHPCSSYYRRMNV